MIQITVPSGAKKPTPASAGLASAIHIPGLAERRTRKVQRLEAENARLREGLRRRGQPVT